MSRYNRPMRRYSAAAVTCQTCGGLLYLDNGGNWAHTQKPERWHYALPAGSRPPGPIADRPA